MPIIDWTPNEYNNYVLEGGTKYKISSDVAMGLAELAAQTISNNICADKNVDGVFLDFEGVNTLGKKPLVYFYTQLSSQLHSSNCGNNPNGKYLTIYLSDKNINWSTVASIFNQNNNSFIAIPIYDIQNFSTPPQPDEINNYKTYAANIINQASQQNIPFSVIAPIGASFGSFQSYGSYTPNNNNLDFNYNYTSKVDFSSTNTPQLGYFKAVQDAVCAVTQNPNFLGIDYWSWQEYINPGDYLRGPNLPDPATVSYLQQFADCPKSLKAPGSIKPPQSR